MATFEQIPAKTTIGQTPHLGQDGSGTQGRKLNSLGNLEVPRGRLG
jgi:hypothetical protein